MVTSAIATLPITPRADPKLGLMMLPVLMDNLGDKLGYEKVLCLNLNGVKLEEEVREPSVSGYVSACEALGVVPDWVFRDDLYDQAIVQKVFNKLLERGAVHREVREVLRCQCGAVETLAVAENISGARRLYEKVAGVPTCKLCRTPLRAMELEVYLLSVCELPDGFQATPDFASKELEALMERFVGKKVLISRSRRTGVEVYVGHSVVHLDVDFAWQMCLPILLEYGYRVEVLLGSHRNLFGLFMALLIQQLCCDERSKLLIPAYCLTRNEADAVELKQYSEWDPKTTRLFLAAHTTFTKKETRFDLSLTTLIERVAGDVSGVRDVQSLPYHTAVKECDAVEIRQSLLEARGSGVLPDSIYKILGGLQ